MKKAFLLTLAFAMAYISVDCKGPSEPDAGVAVTMKPRTIVTTDGEVDDQNSFHRLLLYANEFDLEGLIYSSSQWHYSGDGKGTLFTSEMPSTARRYGERTDLRWSGTAWMQELIDKYASVYDNLLKNDGDYPSPEYLKSIVKVGNIEFEGEMSKDTEGSDRIKSILLDDEPGPVYVQIWGGTNTLARALKSIEDEYRNTGQWAEVYRKVSDKTFIYTVLDQDATYNNYVAPNWPGIRVIYNSSQFWSFAYMWARVVPDTLKPFFGGEWISENIKFGHGPLLESYYTWGDGQHIPDDPEHNQGDSLEMAGRGRTQYDFIAEGDSPSFFFLLDYGLRSMEDPAYGGLGGRFVRSAANPRRWEDGRDVADFDPYTGERETSYPQIRWLETLQNDFAARADWCVMEYEDANHAPVVHLEHPADITAQPGDRVQLEGVAEDPDGDRLEYHWWQYVEAGTCDHEVSVEGSGSSSASFIMPQDAETGSTVHMILEVKDGGNPRLTRYRRVIVTTG